MARSDQPVYGRQQLARALNGEPISFYTGFDPSAASLHIGNLVQVLLMRHLQEAGHHAYAVSAVRLAL